MAGITLDLLGVDELLGRLAEMPGIFRGARTVALKSVGYFFKEELQAYAFGGHWAKLHPHTGVIDRAKRLANGSTPSGLGKFLSVRRGRGKKRRRARHLESTRQDPFNKLRRAVRYAVPQGDAFVEISFMASSSRVTGMPNHKLRRLVGLQEEDQTVSVTERMSRFFFGAGFPVQAGQTLHVPARPWFGPVFETKREAARERFTDAYYAAVAAFYAGKASRSRRSK